MPEFPVYTGKYESRGVIVRDDDGVDLSYDTPPCRFPCDLLNLGRFDGVPEDCILAGRFEAAVCTVADGC